MQPPPRKLAGEVPVARPRACVAAEGVKVARIIFNNEIAMEQGVPMVALGGAKLVPPPHGFLQATREGETALQDHVLSLTAKAKHIADLFAGLGTFTFALARNAKVHAVEQEHDALAALATAAKSTPGLKPITTEKRDLFKEPLTPPELKVFDAVLLDPPPRRGRGSDKGPGSSLWSPALPMFPAMPIASPVMPPSW